MKIKALFQHHWIEVSVALVAFAAIHLVFLADTFRGDHVDSTKAADLGQFLSGYAGTIILIFSVLALVIQLRNQMETNNRTSFESRFFELLGYHRNNVDEIGIGSDKKGRRVFVSMIREFREAMLLVDEACAQVAADYPRPLRLDLAYMAFYYGVGPNSTRVLKECLTKHPGALAGRVIKRMEEKQSDYRNCMKNASDSRRGEEERGSWVNDASHITRLSYCPFDGHQSRLGHYYRHLYQLIKYLHQYAPAGTAQDYADIVRAQLTNHEQALLCLNSLATIGEAWITLGYLTDYSLIKNIPASFFDKTTELDLQARFPQIQFEFMRDKDSKPEPNRSLA